MDETHSTPRRVSTPRSDWTAAGADATTVGGLKGIDGEVAVFKLTPG